MKKRWIAIALLTVLLMGIGGAIGKVGVRQESGGSAYSLYFVERDLRSADGGDALRSEERTLEDGGLSTEELAAALVAVLTLLFVGGEDYSPLALLAIALVCTGAIGLGVVDATEDPELRAARQAEGNRKYSKSFLALALPVAYCLLDAAGTFADNRVLETLDEGSANCAYELTFLFAAVLCFIYVVFIKKDRLLPKREAPKYIGAICETAGQFAYIYAIADTSHLAMSAPIISSYCAASVLWSRLFLKEKLSWKHYAMILLVVIGIAVMGVFDI